MKKTTNTRAALAAAKLTAERTAAALDAARKAAEQAAARTTAAAAALAAAEQAEQDARTTRDTARRKARKARNARTPDEQRAAMTPGQKSADTRKHNAKVKAAEQAEQDAAAALAAAREEVKTARAALATARKAEQDTAAPLAAAKSENLAADQELTAATLAAARDEVEEEYKDREAAREKRAEQAAALAKRTPAERAAAEQAARIKLSEQWDRKNKANTAAAIGRAARDIGATAEQRAAMTPAEKAADTRRKNKAARTAAAAEQDARKAAEKAAARLEGEDARKAEQAAAAARESTGRHIDRGADGVTYRNDRGAFMFAAPVKCKICGYLDTAADLLSADTDAPDYAQKLYAFCRRYTIKALTRLYARNGNGTALFHLNSARALPRQYTTFFEQANTAAARGAVTNDAYTNSPAADTVQAAMTCILETIHYNNTLAAAAVTPVELLNTLSNCIIERNTRPALSYAMNTEKGPAAAFAFHGEPETVVDSETGAEKEVYTVRAWSELVDISAEQRNLNTFESAAEYLTETQARTMYALVIERKGINETARALGISQPSARANWKRAAARLYANWYTGDRTREFEEVWQAGRRSLSRPVSVIDRATGARTDYATEKAAAAALNVSGGALCDYITGRRNNERFRVFRNEPSYTRAHRAAPYVPRVNVPKEYRTK